MDIAHVQVIRGLMMIIGIIITTGLVKVMEKLKFGLYSRVAFAMIMGQIVWILQEVVQHNLLNR